MLKKFTIGLCVILCFSSLQAEPYVAGGEGLSIDLLSPTIDEHELEDTILVFIDPECHACGQMKQALSDCDPGIKTNFMIVASVYPKDRTFEDKLWYLSNGGDLKELKNGCQNDCTRLHTILEPSHKFKNGMPNKIYRLNRLARNTAIWKKLLGYSAKTPSFYNTKTNERGVIESKEQARRLLQCKQ